MNIEEDDFAAPVRLVGERLGYVHVGENHRGCLGSGHIAFTQFFDALAEVNHAAAVSFEAFSSAVVSPTLLGDLAIRRDLWSDGSDLAIHAREFIAGHLNRAPSAR